MGAEAGHGLGGASVPNVVSADPCQGLDRKRQVPRWTSVAGRDLSDGFGVGYRQQPCDSFVVFGGNNAAIGIAVPVREHPRFEGM